MPFVQVKISTGHEVVKICIWSHHLILTTHRKSGPLPFIVLTQILPLQLSTSTSECSDMHRPYLFRVFCIMAISMESKGQDSVGKPHLLSTHSIQVQAFYSCQLRKNLSLLHLSITLKELYVSTKWKKLL